MADDNSSEIGVADLFKKGQSGGSAGRPGQSGSRGIVVDDSSASRGWGKGPATLDTRKFRYDRLRAEAMPAVQFTASKADRLDADAAGDVLHRIHVTLGIESENEARLAGFDNALFWQHILNGASIMQPERGVLSVDGMTYDIHDCLKLIGEVQLRRFFRAYADEIVEVARGVLASYDPYDAIAIEKRGQLIQVATERGLHKYPEYAFDAADACLQISVEARRAVMASKAFVLPRVNTTDGMPVPVAQSFAKDSLG